ncbi:MAG: FliH/SctL family protein [Rhizobacter sp.]
MNSSNRLRNVPAPAGSARSKASLYARFIPREEVASCAAWELGDLSPPKPAPPPPPPPPPPEEPVVDAAAVLTEQLHLARQSGYQDGYRDGLVALEQFKQSFAHQATMQIGALLQSTGAQLDALQQEMAEALTRTAMGLARQVVRSELEMRPIAVAKVAEEALDALLLSARHITLRVHPDDHPLVAEGAGEMLAARGARLIADPTIGRGGCIVESDIGVIDASLETRWRRASAGLGSDEPWHAEEGAGPQGLDAEADA